MIVIYYNKFILSSYHVDTLYHTRATYIFHIILSDFISSISSKLFSKGNKMTTVDDATGSASTPQAARCFAAHQHSNISNIITYIVSMGTVVQILRVMLRADMCAVIDILHAAL